MGEEQQNAFEEIKCRLIRLSTLHMPNHEGRFHLYLDTTKFAMGRLSIKYKMENQT